MSYKKDKRIIELFGLPGSGKTSLFKRIKKDYPDAKLVNKVFCHRNKCFWIFIIVKESIKNSCISLIRFKLSLLFNLYKKEALKVGEYNIVDEGWLQRILSFYENKLTDDDLKKIFKHIEIPDKVILLEREENSCFRRYNNLKNHRTRLGSGYLENWKKVVIHNFKQIKSYLRAQNIDIIEFRKKSDLDNIL